MTTKRNRPGPDARKTRPQGRSPEEVAVAKRIRATYIECRSEWETVRRGVPFRYAVPRSYDIGGKVPMVDGVRVEGAKSKPKPPVWFVLAARFADLRIDPEDYIRKVFDSATGKRPPEPDRLLDGPFMAHYDKARRLDSSGVRDSLTIQKRTAAMYVSYWQSGGMDFVDSHAFVLGDESIELSALFRYCLAVELKPRGKVFARIADVYRTAAAVQFQRYRDDYMDGWGRFIPEEFVTRSRRLYEAALRGSDVTGGWDGEETD